MMAGRNFTRRLRALTLALTGFATCHAAGAAGDLELEWGHVDDPRIRETLFDLYDQSYFTGIVRLVSSRNLIDLGKEKDVGNLLLSALYLAYGIPGQAQSILLDMSDRGVSSELQNRLWYYLARYYYQQDDAVKARTALQQIRGDIDGDLDTERLSLSANLLSREEKNSDAVRTLQRIKGDNARSLYARYNLGVLMLRTGKTDEGIKVLSQLTAVRSLEPDVIALAEQANLALANHYLRNNDPVQAKKALMEIRLDSPLAAKALLGMGWTYAATDNYQSALNAWNELLKYSVSDPAVMEGYLASGYAYSKLQALNQALDQYEKSSVVMKTEMRRVDSIVETVRDGSILDRILDREPLTEAGWFGDMKSLPEIPAQSYLLDFFATHQFQQAYKSYRDLRFLSGQLSEWMSSLDKYSGMSITFRESYLKRTVDQQTKVARLLEKSRAYIQQITIDYLQQQKQLIEENLKQARFQMAQILDQAGRNAMPE